MKAYARLWSQGTLPARSEVNSKSAASLGIIGGRWERLVKILITSDLLKKYGMNAGAEPEIFRIAQRLRERMTPEERILWGELSKKPAGFKFRRQHPFGIYVLDFFCHSARLSVEIDGGYHELTEQKRLDEQRTNFINSFGVKELRFTNQDIQNRIEKVLEVIFQNLQVEDK